MEADEWPSEYHRGSCARPKMAHSLIVVRMHDLHLHDFNRPCDGPAIRLFRPNQLVQTATQPPVAELSMLVTAPGVIRVVMSAG